MSRRAVTAALAAMLLAGCASSNAPAGGASTSTAAGPTAIAAVTIGPTSPVASPMGPTAPSVTAAVPTNPPDADTLAPPTATTDLQVVRISTLPPEAMITLQRIKDGGPYPYPNDGIMFQNREGRLPEQAMGFYQEYTVPTPGSSDRGARRIVTGADGSRFWTQDHYASFREVVAPWP